MRKRVTSLFLVLAVAFAYATGVAGTAPTLRPGSATLAGDSQPAICPLTRPSLHLGRQVEVRAGVPLGMPVSLPAEVDGLSARSWARVRLALGNAAQPERLLTSSCSPRGPPAYGFKHSES